MIRFAFNGQTACMCTRQDWANDLDEFRYVGCVDIAQKDIDLVAACRSYGTWSTARVYAEGEWRWANNRAAYQDEVARAEQAARARRILKNERYEKRLKTLTWEKLLGEQPFSRWNAHPPFPPPEFVTAARDRIHSAILDLQSLGPTPKKAHVRAILKVCVEWFNTMDEKFGNVIETEGREDVCAALEDSHL